jgi:hypothetical protein
MVLSVRKPPRVTETLTDVRPVFHYSGCPYNPLRILVKDVDGNLLPERVITVILGARDELVASLNLQERLRHRGLGVQR